MNEAYNMDCMEAMKQMPDKCFDLAVVDPPYGDARFGRGWNRIGGWFDNYKGSKPRERSSKIMAWDKAPGKEYFEELYRVSRNQIIWGGNYFSLPPTRCFLIWRKTRISEDFSMAMAEYAWTSFQANSKVFDCVPQGGKEKRFHPTQKPIDLYKWCYRLFANPDDKILDTHLGSQSSRIAAYQMNLDFVGFEIDPEYYRLGCERFERHTAQQSLFYGD